jgi:hypothetical protein
MASSGMLRSVALVRTDVSEEHSTSIIRVARIGELATDARSKPHDVITQTMAFFIVTAVKTSNLSLMLVLYRQFLAIGRTSIGVVLPSAVVLFIAEESYFVSFHFRKYSSFIHRPAAQGQGPISGLISTIVIGKTAVSLKELKCRQLARMGENRNWYRLLLG